MGEGDEGCSVRGAWVVQQPRPLPCAHACVPPTEPAQATAAPAEPFDNTTYKNLQHHDYTPYTFLDLNLNLSKFRMPQPSSGRESPRH